MRVLVVDDELAARLRLKKLLAEYESVDIVAEADNGLTALEQIRLLAPDVVFLDIQMPGLDGFQVLRSIPSDTKMPLIIFATGYDQHALRAFESNALAYLLKPVERDRLDIAVDRARRLLESETARTEDEKKLRNAASQSPRLSRIVARKHDRFVLLEPSSIVLFRSEEGIVRAKTPDDSFWVNYQLNELESSLESEVFFRARREVLVNISKVNGIKPYDRSTFVLTMNDAQQTQVLVSERQAKELRRLLPGL